MCVYKNDSLIDICILYKVRHKGFDKTTICSMYFALFHSYLNYGLNVWGLADKNVLKQIEVIQNNAIRAIVGIKSHESCSKHYKDLKIIKLNDIIFINKIKFIWDFESKTVPICFQKYFQHAKFLHRHKTRFARKNNTHGLNSFTNSSISASNKFKDLHWYKSITSRFALVKNLNRFL